MATPTLTTRQLLQAWPGLTDEDRALLLSAVATRGKWKGFLLSRAPSGNTPRSQAWNALVSNLAPARVSIANVILGNSETFTRLDKALTSTGLDQALRIVEPSFRWNLVAHHFLVGGWVDVERARALLAKRLGLCEVAK
jgi:hypothetical protein